jgi:hypothetical protein
MSKRSRLLGRLKHVYSHNAKLVLDVSNDDIGLIIEGVEKQIRKKVAYFKLGVDAYECPNCEDISLKISAGQYCTYCGQKLDWSEADVEAKED